MHRSLWNTVYASLLYGLFPIWEEVLSDEGFNNVGSAVIAETFSVPDMMNPLSILAQKVNCPKATQVLFIIKYISIFYIFNSIW